MILQLKWLSFLTICVEIISAKTLLDFPVLSRAFYSIDAYDGLVYSADAKSNDTITPPFILEALKSPAELDKNWYKTIGVYAIPLPAKRLIYSPVVEINPEYHDIREIGDAAKNGMRRALQAGVKRPLLVLSQSKRFPNSRLVAILGALEALYTDLQVRETMPDRRQKVYELSVWNSQENNKKTVLLAEKLEAGRVLARDIGGSDPERMSPIRVEEYVRDAFPESSGITFNVISSEEVFNREYPLFAAVTRAANTVKRHKGRIIHLAYTAPNPERTLFLVGKGITYDTGGVNVKKPDSMTGMSRDKCGAAAVAGFMKIVSLLKPQNVSVVGIMAMARNSIGEESYLPDEILTARSGRRVRVANSDAEGRMVLADALYHAKEMAKYAVNPIIMSIATLTGHARKSVGPYTIVLDNGPAKAMNNAIDLQKAGDEIGDMIEISRIRREDYAAYKSNTEDADVIQSSAGPRGHQGPAAFLIMASGLDEHGLDSPRPIPYFHLDIAGSSGQYPKPPTAAPILALSQMFLNLDSYK